MYVKSTAGGGRKRSKTGELGPAEKPLKDKKMFSTWDGQASNDRNAPKNTSKKHPPHTVLRKINPPANDPLKLHQNSYCNRVYLHCPLQHISELLTQDYWGLLVANDAQACS